MTKKTEMAADRSVQAVGRTLSILEAFLKHDGSLSLSELSEQTGLFKSVILRYMLTMEAMGYVRKRVDGLYELGPRVYELGCKFARNQDLSEHVLPVLARLSGETLESSSFYIRDGGSRLCVFRKDSSQHIKASIAPGTRLPMDDSATAEVLRRFADRPVLDWTLENCVMTTSSTVNEITARLLPTASMSAPILRYGGSLVGALTVSGPAARFDPTQEHYKRLLLEAAKGLSARLVGA